MSSTEIIEEEKFNFRVREVSELLLTLREDLQFTPHHESGEPCYIVEDSVRSQYFRIGIAEYLLISMFDGKTTIGQALVRLARIEGDHALTEQEATIICKWLVDSELATTDTSTKTDRLADLARSYQRQKNMGQLNPVSTRLPLFYPDRFFEKITPLAKYFFGKAFACLGFLIALFAFYQVFQNWNSFTIAADGITHPSRWLWLLVVWVVLKLIHETAHGVVCKKYGGSVYEAGAILILFIPLAYVDVTSSWRFRSKWKRIHTAFAGMYIELWIAAFAAILWSCLGTSVLSDVCFNIVAMASLTTLLFNANPLMRFDGYYFLSDLLEIPNLYSQGSQYLSYLCRRYVMGEKQSSGLGFTWRDNFIRVYGIAALIWRVFICFWIIVGACLMYHGVGLIIAVFAVALWLGLPAYRIYKYICKDDGSSWHRMRRLAIATLLFVGFGFTFCRYVPWPGAHRARAIVQYEPLDIVRASSPGFVREVFVQPGDSVAEGQAIARLENPALVSELEDLALAIKQSTLKSRVFKQTEEMHSYQAEMEQLASLRTKHEEKQHQCDDLVLRSKSSGVVVARNLHLLLGTYLTTGDELAAIGNESCKELRLAIPQKQFKHFQYEVGEPISARLSGGVVLTSTMKQVVPRATSLAPDPSMYASNGGPLASRPNEDDEEGAPAMVLLNPHFTGIVSLSEEQSGNVRVGQQGVIWFGHGRQSVGTVLWSTLKEALPEIFKRQYSSLSAMKVTIGPTAQ